MVPDPGGITDPAERLKKPCITGCSSGNHHRPRRQRVVFIGSWHRSGIPTSGPPPRFFRVGKSNVRVMVVSRLGTVKAVFSPVSSQIFRARPAGVKRAARCASRHEQHDQLQPGENGVSTSNHRFRRPAKEGWTDVCHQLPAAAKPLPDVNYRRKNALVKGQISDAGPHQLSGLSIDNVDTDQMLRPILKTISKQMSATASRWRYTVIRRTPETRLYADRCRQRRANDQVAGDNFGCDARASTSGL